MSGNTGGKKRGAPVKRMGPFTCDGKNYLKTNFLTLNLNC